MGAVVMSMLYFPAFKRLARSGHQGLRSVWLLCDDLNGGAILSELALTTASTTVAAWLFTVSACITTADIALGTSGNLAMTCFRPILRFLLGFAYLSQGGIWVSSNFVSSKHDE